MQAEAGRKRALDAECAPAAAAPPAAEPAVLGWGPPPLEPPVSTLQSAAAAAAAPSPQDTAEIYTAAATAFVPRSAQRAAAAAWVATRK